MHLVRENRLTKDFSQESQESQPDPEQKLGGPRRWGKRLPLALVISVALTLVAGVYYLGWRSPLFKIREIIVEGNSPLSYEKVVAVSGLRLGENLLRIDLVGARERLLRHPRLEDAYLRRSFPKRLQIRVKESRAIALFKGDKLYEVNDKGLILPALNEESDYHLPMLDGICLLFESGHPLFSMF